MKNFVDVIKSISDETRLRILNLLYSKELCVYDVVEMLNITQSKASRHLQYLKNAGLVKDRRYTQRVYYSMAESIDIKFLDSLIYENIRTLEPFKSDLNNLEVYKK